MCEKGDPLAIGPILYGAPFWDRSIFLINDH